MCHFVVAWEMPYLLILIKEKKKEIRIWDKPNRSSPLFFLSLFFLSLPLSSAHSTHSPYSFSFFPFPCFLLFVTHACTKRTCPCFFMLAETHSPSTSSSFLQVTRSFHLFFSSSSSRLSLAPTNPHVTSPSTFSLRHTRPSHECGREV